LIRDQCQYKADNDIAKHSESHEQANMFIGYAKGGEEMNKDDECSSIRKETEEALQEEELHIACRFRHGRPAGAFGQAAKNRTRAAHAEVLCTEVKRNLIKDWLQDGKNCFML
jgi:hypothetical protein